jgi:hypothetical protein
MDTEGRQAHWEKVYTTKGENEVSWFQGNPTPSLDRIAKAGASTASAIIDVGGGASRLVDALIEKGFRVVTVLDLSQAALVVAKARLSNRADQVRWVVADVTVCGSRSCAAMWEAAHSGGSAFFASEDYPDLRTHAFVTHSDLAGQ